MDTEPQRSFFRPPLPRGSGQRPPRAGGSGRRPLGTLRMLLNPPPYRRPPAPPKSPLTHHEILGAMGPFTRRGLHADLGASPRDERRILFRPAQLPASADGLPPLREVLSLELPPQGGYRLVRTLDSGPGRGLSATLAAGGPDPERLLDEIGRIPARRLVGVVAGVPVERSYRLEPPTDETGPWEPVLVTARAVVHGVRIWIDAERDRGVSLKLRLSAASGQRLVLSEDLVAVLGRDFSPLTDYGSHWDGTLRVPDAEPARTAAIEDRLATLVAHLARTLAEPPARFHDRFRRERGRVMLRRALPMLTLVSLVAATPALGLLPIEEGTLLRLLVLQAPLMMLVVFFMLHEVPHIEIPPRPRALRQDRWVADKR